MKEFCPYCQNDPVTHQQQKEICGICDMETKVAKRKQTRADKLRSMTDEELAEWLNDTLVSPYFYLTTAEAWLCWLKQEVEP